MLIPVEIYNLLTKLLTETPLHVPNRNDFIKQDVRDYITKSDLFTRKFNQVDLTQIKSFSHFAPSDECIDELIRCIPRNHVDEPVCNIALVPAIRTCCGVSIRMDNSRVYDVNDVKSCRYYHGRCMKCKKVFYYNFYEQNGMRYFMHSSH